jgi:retron-type reverse transcriptase
MSASIGNQYWKNRVTHGRKRKFATTEELRQKAIEYFSLCDQQLAYKSKFARYRRKDFFRFAGIGVATFA